MGGFEAVEGVLYDEALGGGEVHTADAFEVEVGGGFDAGGIATADDFVEVRDKLELFQPAVDPVVRGAGDDCAGDVFFAAVGQGLADAGHGIEFCDFLADPGVSLDADGGPVEGFPGEFFEPGFGRPGVEIGADALDVFFKWKVVAVFKEDVLHRLVDGPFGVEDDTIEVEEEGARIHGMINNRIGGDRNVELGGEFFRL